MSLNDVYEFESQKAKVGAGAETFDLPKPPRGSTIKLTSVSIVDETNNTTITGIGIFDGANTHWLKKSATTTALVGLQWDGEALLPDTHNVRILVTGGVANDTLTMQARGQVVQESSQHVVNRL